MNTMFPDDEIPHEPTGRGSDRTTDSDEQSLRSALEAAVARDAPCDEFARIILSSPFINQLIVQFTGRWRSGPLFKVYSKVVDDWRSVTREIVSANTKAKDGKVVRESLRARRFGAYWNYLVRLKCLTARDRIYREIRPSGETGLGLLEPATSPHDDPASQASYLELVQLLHRLRETADELPRAVDRVVMRAILAGDFDERRLANSEYYRIVEVRSAAKRVRSLIAGILRSGGWTVPA
jgi:hypothetical protein